MNNLERIKNGMRLEVQNKDMSLSHIEFNRRGLEVVMTYVYFPETHENKDPHMAAHNRDPEFLSLEEADALMEFARENNIEINERNDEFI